MFVDLKIRHEAVDLVFHVEVSSFAQAQRWAKEQLEVASDVVEALEEEDENQ
ncbi:hypothetical protein D3C81_1627630 [compost metagenome]